MNAVLLDTNVLVYAHAVDLSDPRVLKAKEICTAAADGSGAVSFQNLAEFCSVCLNKTRPPVPMEAVRRAVREMSASYRVFLPTPDTIPLALSAVERHRLSYWDALIWAVAKAEGIGEILSEDFQHGRSVDGVIYRNPFK